MLSKVNAQRFALLGAGAGVDSVWEQRKLEARKMLEKAAESPASSARFVGRFLLCKIHRLKKDTAANLIRFYFQIQIVQQQ